MNARQTSQSSSRRISHSSFASTAVAYRRECGAPIEVLAGVTDENLSAKGGYKECGTRCPETSRIVVPEGRPHAADLEEGRIEYECDCGSRPVLVLPIGPNR